MLSTYSLRVLTICVHYAVDVMFGGQYSNGMLKDLIKESTPKEVCGPVWSICQVESYESIDFHCGCLPGKDYVGL